MLALRRGANAATAHAPVCGEIKGASRRRKPPYLKKVNDAGSFKAYEQLHLKRLVALLETKLPQIPKDVHSHVAYFWAHVGDY